MLWAKEASDRRRNGWLSVRELASLEDGCFRSAAAERGETRSIRGTQPLRSAALQALGACPHRPTSGRQELFESLGSPTRCSDEDRTREHWPVREIEQ